MARKPRIEYEGALNHVMSRGDRGEPIFDDDADRETFLRTVGEVKERTGWLVHAYVLITYVELHINSDCLRDSR